MSLIKSFYWYLYYFAWTTAYLALSYSITVREQERHSSALRAEAQDAQNRAMRYQINPHFLFNTLNAIAGLIAEDRAQAEAMVVNLSGFFRASLAFDPTEDVRLADEIALQMLYLDIERVRFPERIAVSVALPEPLRDALVPSLLAPAPDRECGEARGRPLGRQDQYPVSRHRLRRAGSASP